MLSSLSPSSASGMSSIVIIVCSLKQSNQPSHPRNIVRGSMAREHEHRADQVPQTFCGKQCRFQRFIDGTSIPAMHGLLNVRWCCLVIMFPIVAPCIDFPRELGQMFRIGQVFPPRQSMVS